MHIRPVFLVHYLSQKDTIGNENSGSHNPALHDVHKPNLDHKLAVDFGEPHDNDGQLGEDGGDDHGDAQSAESVPLEEGHEIAETAEQHHEHVDAQGVGVQAVFDLFLARLGVGQPWVGAVIVTAQQEQHRYDDHLPAVDRV